MDDLTFNTGQTPKTPGPAQPAAAAAAGEAAPAPLAGPGDLVVVAGLGGDPLQVARSMAAVVRGQVSAGQDGTLLLAPEVKAGGALAGTVRRPIQDRKSALAARAKGVERGHSVFVAFGLGRGGPDLAGLLPMLAGLEADQLWVAVDAGRKQEDTARWVGLLRETAVVDAMAVEGLGCTSTPETVLELGLPIGWVDGARS